MENLCIARMWRGHQCTRYREKNDVFCRQHARGKLPYGRYDVPIPVEELHRRLHRAAVCDRKQSFKYYSRDKMWEEAKRFDYIN